MMADSPPSGTIPLKKVYDAGGSNDKKEIDRLSTSIQFDDPFNVQFTSGTTGQPKGALLSHHNVVNNAFFVGKRLGFDKKVVRLCLAVPLFHCFGSIVGALAATVHGSTAVFPAAGFDAKATVQCFEEERITSCYGTPTMFVDILSEFRKNPVNMDAASGGIMAGAPCPEELVNYITHELNMKDLLVSYGMTETSPVTFVSFPSDPPHIRSGTIGYPLDHTEAKIVDKDGKTVPVGESGELLIRGYCNFRGYWDDDAKTAEMMGPDRWLKTGDLASVSEDGYAMIRGRIKDLIIRGGENIYPAEIENFYMTHPDVTEAQVFGIPDSRMGEETAMWIRLSRGSTAKDLDLKSWSKGKIAHYKIPKYILIKEEFPRTVSGKIQKFKIRDITITELGLQVKQ